MPVSILADCTQAKPGSKAFQHSLAKEVAATKPKKKGGVDVAADGTSAAVVKAEAKKAD